MMGGGNGAQPVGILVLLATRAMIVMLRMMRRGVMGVGFWRLGLNLVVMQRSETRFLELSWTRGRWRAIRIDRCAVGWVKRGRRRLRIAVERHGC